MKKIVLFTLCVMISSTVFAEGINEPPSCNGEISLLLKKIKESKTNASVIVTIRIKNTSTNKTLMFLIENLPTDFTWSITSPLGKDISPVYKFPSGGSGWFPRLRPLESREFDYNLSGICNFNEPGNYKVVVKKQVVFFIQGTPNKHKTCEIVSNPLVVTIPK